MELDRQPHLATPRNIFAISFGSQKFFCYEVGASLELPMIRLLSEEDGATAIEYGLICSLIFLVIVTAVTLYASKTTAMWTLVAAHI